MSHGRDVQGSTAELGSVSPCSRLTCDHEKGPCKDFAFFKKESFDFPSCFGPG